MPHDSYQALYLHIPFCVKRCSYCDFVTAAVPSDSSKIDTYIEDLCIQIRHKAKEGELADIKTVYIGGGTPTYIGLSRLSLLMYTLALSMHLDTWVECTMEANPESLTENIVRDVFALGVNRLSLGVQSFDDEILRILGRPHTADQAKEALRIAQERFENISVDLMCGIPGQSAASFGRSVETAINLGVQHISVYPLTIEDHTPFAKMVLRGEIPDVDDDVEAEQMKLAETLLTAAGYERYEVASYAKPGYQCKHNIAYWTGVPYLGLGKSAATMTQNSERRMRLKDGIVTDDLTPAQMRAEDLMLSMRMSVGVSEEQITSSQELLPNIGSCFKGLQEKGLVVLSGGRYKPTELGWLCGNELYGDIFDLAP